MLFGLALSLPSLKWYKHLPSLKWYKCIAVTFCRNLSCSDWSVTVFPVLPSIAAICRLSKHDLFITGPWGSDFSSGDLQWIGSCLIWLKWVMYALCNTNCHLSRLGGRAWSRSRGPRRRGRHPVRAAALGQNNKRGCCRMIRVSVSLAPWTSISDHRETAEGGSVSSSTSSRAFSNSSFKFQHKPPCTRRHWKSGSQYSHCPTAFKTFNDQLSCLLEDDLVKSREKSLDQLIWAQWHG